MSSDIILPSDAGVFHARQPVFIGKRNVSAFIEDENGMTNRETDSIQLDFSNDPMGIMYLAIFQTLEIETGKLREEIEFLKTEIEKLKGEKK
jgi:hypothetical protein